MSYCVHCGVELASYEKQCPLCGTIVNDPNPPVASEPRFVDLLENKDKHINRHFMTVLISVIMFIPFIVSAIVNFCINGTLNWSLYVLGAVVICWFYFILPFRFELSFFYYYFLIDYLVTLLFVLVIFILSHGQKWFYYLGLPITTYTFIFVVFFHYIIRRSKLNIIGKIGYILIGIACLILLIDMSVSYFSYKLFIPTWSLYGGVPSLALGIVFTIICKSEKITEWIAKNLFI